jgi:uncharacterized protein (DUF697 family)/GTP-binding protein EngB required for normal cell division
MSLNERVQLSLNDNIQNFVEREYNKYVADLGNAVILIGGQTGVGKSTLVNAVLGVDMAPTGVGKPVTQGCVEYKFPEKSVTLLDTRGLEMEDFAATLKALEDEIKRRQSLPATEWVHLAWVCISERSARIQRGEEQLISMLKAHEVPTVIVITKMLGDSAFAREVERITGSEHVIRVRAIADIIKDEEEVIVLKPKGLDQLVQRSMELIPDAVGGAFARAQIISMNLKRRSANRVVQLAASAAATAAAAPIPVADAVAIIPIQLSMLVGITACFGLDITRATLATLLGGILGAAGATIVGRMAAGQLLKLLPGLGSIAGGLVNATVAAALTTTVGMAFIEVLVATQWTGDTDADWRGVTDALRQRLRDAKLV